MRPSKTTRCGPERGRRAARLARSGIAGLLLLAASAPALADAASEQLVHGFVAWVDSSPDWSASVSVVRSEGSDTLAEGLIFSRDEPGISVSMETLRLSDLAGDDAGGFSASAISLSGGAVIGEGIEASIPAATVESLSMPSFAAVTLDPKHLMSSMARFYTLAAAGELAELRIPEVLVMQREPLPDGAKIEVRSRYRNVLVEDFSDGVLRHQEVGPITIGSSGATDAEAFELTIDKLEAERVDVGGFARILDAQAYRDGRGDAIWRPLFSRALYSGLTGRGGGATFRLNELAVENVEGRQPAKPFTALWDRMLDTDVPQDAKDGLALDAVTTMLSAWRVGAVRLDGMSLDAPDDGVNLSLNGISLSRWSSEGLDSFILDGLRVEGRGGFLSLGSLELAGFIAPDLKALVKFAAIEKNIEPQRHAAAIQDAFSALPRLDHFGVKEVVAGQNETDSVSLSELSFDFAEWNALYAGSTDMRLGGLIVPRRLLELDPETTEIFETLGYDDLAIAMSVSDRWNPDTGTDDAVWRFSIADAMDMELSYSLTGMTLDWLMRATALAGASDSSSAALMAMLNELGVARATLNVTDRSLLDRAFAVAAQKQGLKVEGSAYREQMRAALPFIISAAVPAELAKLVTGPLQTFLAGGQTLSAEAAPTAPLGVQELVNGAANPLGLPALLNLTLKSETPAQ